MHLNLVATALVAALYLSGCADPSSLRRAAPAAGSEPVELRNTPFFAQKSFQCGPAALATVLSYAGKQAEPDRLVERVYLPGRKGSLQVELMAATRREGLVPYPIESTLGALVDELGAARPILVLQNLGPAIIPVWHYAVVIGYDPSLSAIILRSGATRRKVVPIKRFLQTWESAGSWGIVVLAPGEMPTRPHRERYLRAIAALEAVEQHGPALSGYRAALQQWPGDSAARLGLGNSWYGLGELPKAEKSYRRLIKDEPRNIAGYNNLAQVLADQYRYEEALAVIASGMSLAPEGSDVHRILRETEAEIRQKRWQGSRDRHSLHPELLGLFYAALCATDLYPIC